MTVAEVIGIVLLIWVVFAGGYYLGRRSALHAIWDESSEIDPPPITMGGIDRTPSPFYRFKLLHPMLGFYKKIRARFWRLFREPVNLDECGKWPPHLVEGDYYRSPNNSLGQKYEIFNGVWTPRN